MNSLWDPCLREKGDDSLALVNNCLNCVSYCRPWPPRPWPLINDAFLYIIITLSTPDHCCHHHCLLTQRRGNPAPVYLMLHCCWSLPCQAEWIFCQTFFVLFLAPSGARWVTMCIRLSVRGVLICLELLIFIFLPLLELSHLYGLTS